MNLTAKRHSAYLVAVPTKAASHIQNNAPGPPETIAVATPTFKDETDGKHGEVSSFAALCTALSATIGTGNIVGVAKKHVQD